jgi:hypothetical protein
MKYRVSSKAFEIAALDHCKPVGKTERREIKLSALSANMHH